MLLASVGLCLECLFVCVSKSADPPREKEREREREREKERERERERERKREKGGMGKKSENPMEKKKERV